MIISLTGFMGVGKSTIAYKLSKILLCSSIDLDNYIEQSENRSIREIYTKDGEVAFRKIEEEALKRVIEDYCSHNQLLILSLGGGTLLSAKNRDVVKNSTTTIYLKASCKTIINRLDNPYKKSARPLLDSNNGDGLQRLMEDRVSGYEECANYTISTDGKTVEDIISEITTLI